MHGHWDRFFEAYCLGLCRDDQALSYASSLKRRGVAVGVISNTEIQDATPAAMIAHTRRRATYDEITGQFFGFQPDLLMGGGLANFLPKGAPGAKRRDETDFVAKFKGEGYAFASTATELAAMPGDTRRSARMVGASVTGVVRPRWSR